MQRQTVKAAYKIRVRQALQEEKVSYSNDLHDVLLAKSGNDFWKSWHSKCGDNKASPRQVNGITNDKIIVSNFANTSTSAARQTSLNAVILFTVNMQTCVKIIVDSRAQMSRLLMPRILTKLFAY